MRSCVVLLFASLLTLCEAQGTIVTPVFVLKGRDLLLKLRADPPEGVLYVDWKINKTVTLVRFIPGGEPHVDLRFTGRVQFGENKFSVILKNVQEVDSGVYSAVAATPTGDKLLTEYKVTVQGPVSPVELIVDRVDSSSSGSCDLHVTCRTHNAHISSTFRCVDRVCIQEGGERPEVTTSGASLQVYLLNNVIICNHNNQVHWTHDFKTTEHLCPSNPAEHFCPEHAGSVFLVKMVVFSVGLIIMVSAIITVHLVDFKKHQQRNGCQTRHAAREESSHLKVTF
uniref:Immunoglobulin subtype domain-containing protein n=1 Tax=Gasterosteus aculeatus aculeatus TaxID=481459 RepID=A0AAQ4QVV5_GASAC